MPKKKTKRPDGRYEIKRKMPNGTYKHFFGATISEASAKYEADYQRATIEAQKKNGGATFREMAQAYENYITGSGTPIKRSTITAYRRYLANFVSYFGDTPMEDIDTQAVCSYMERMKMNGKALHTITNAKSVLSCVFKFWCANYHGSGDPVLLASPPAGMKRGSREEPTSEQQRIIHAHPEGCGFWAQLFEYTGLRIGEANGLQWQDVDFDMGVIHVNRAMPWNKNQPYLETPKTKNGYRDVPILTAFKSALLEHKKECKPTDYVMSGGEKPLTQSGYNNRWISYCRSIGLAEWYMHPTKIPKYGNKPEYVTQRKVYKATVTAHQFRHLYASNLFYAGVPDKVAKKLMGHADIMTTRRVYQQFRDEEDKKYIARLDDYVSSREKESS